MSSNSSGVIDERRRSSMPAEAYGLQQIQHVALRIFRASFFYGWKRGADVHDIGDGKTHLSFENTAARYILCMGPKSLECNGLTNVATITNDHHGMAITPSAAPDFVGLPTYMSNVGGGWRSACRQLSALDMPPFGTLYMYNPDLPGAHRAKRIQAVAAYAGVEIVLAPGYEHFVTNRGATFLEKFPTGLVPAFEAANGDLVSESSAIAHYIAVASGSDLVPSTLIGAAQVEQWQSYIDLEILAHLIFAYGVESGYIPGDKKVQLNRIAAAVNSLRKLDEYLERLEKAGKKLYLVDQRLTLADIAVVSGLVRGFSGVYDKEIQERYPHALKFTQTVTQDPRLGGVWGVIELADKSPISTS